MGGDITVYSQSGQGSTFSFSLVLPEMSSEDSLLMAKQILYLAASQAPVRVLIAEDDEDNRQLIRCLVENAGFQVRAVSNGQEAINAFIDWHPHFIWMDMRMPVVDGYQAARHIRALADGNKVKIVALTASVFKEEISNILAAGCDEIVFKPVVEQRLLQVMGRLLNLDYCYDEANKQVQLVMENNVPDLTLLSDALKIELKAAAEQLDIEAVKAITDKMQDYPDQVQAINSWMNGFRFDTLLTALKD